jgi:hypothetical protein
MLKNGSAIVNQISRKRRENRPKTGRRDFVKNYTNAVLTFPWVVGQ